jgi:hypothetical protein
MCGRWDYLKAEEEDEKGDESPFQDGRGGLQGSPSRTAMMIGHRCAKPASIVSLPVLMVLRRLTDS